MDIQIALQIVYLSNGHAMTVYAYKFCLKANQKWRRVRAGIWLIDGSLSFYQIIRMRWNAIGFWWFYAMKLFNINARITF